ncbi:major facilitator superfamily transporter protein [Coniothyrium glycines]
MAVRGLLVALANLLIPAAILVFASGFFPYKPYMPGLAQYEELSRDGSVDEILRQPPAAPFDKLIFMVVDALRSDFVFGHDSGMSFVQSLIRDGTALPFTAHATSPTITMPRVKAITTGSIPSFVDVLLNFAESDTTSTLATQDTWLAQIRAKRFESGTGKLLMYGDDTWLKLFPGFFERADGTSSFFVSDFTEVDNNVTRHVPRELRNDDWNAMILHYLGLDHIGHKAGPRSPNMIPKQIEMDDIVRIIYNAIVSEKHLANTLFVLCGDHGMNEGGNHGGSSPGETSPALVFMSPALDRLTRGRHRQSPTKPKSAGDFEFYKVIEQSDIAPTLAGLLGFPIPRNNLGVFLEEFLDLWENTSDRVQLLYRNAKQMREIVAATYPSPAFADTVLTEAEAQVQCKLDVEESNEPNNLTLACLWQMIVHRMQKKRDANKLLYQFMREAQETMSGAASEYNMTRLTVGTVLALFICVLSLFGLPAVGTITATDSFTTCVCLLYAVLMFASSYVEEEHNFWFWATSGWFMLLFLHNMRKSWYSYWLFHPAIVSMLIHRVIRRWNQTGQKYAGADDIVNSGIFHGSNSLLLWALIGATYMDITVRLSKHVARSIATYNAAQKLRNADADAIDQNRVVAMFAVLPLCGTAFIFKLAFTVKDAPELAHGMSGPMLAWLENTDLVGLARMVFGGLALSALWVTGAEWHQSRCRLQTGAHGNGNLAIALFDLMTLFLITQTKAHNIPLYLLFRAELFFLTRLDLSASTITTTSLFLAQTSFFALGNSNAISSIDLSNAYNGVSGYSVVAVGLLVFFSNWAGPVYWSLAGVLLLGSHGQIQRHINTSELHVADWIAIEREHLNQMARKEEKGRENRKGWGVWIDHVTLLTLWTGVMLLSVMAACTALRQHLFIWTVFSPKYLFAMAWGLAWHFGVTIGLGSLLWWTGTW